MTDPFAQATKHIFNSSIAKDATYTDSSNNIMTVRVVEKSERKNVFDAYAGQYIVIGKTIEMLRPDSADIRTGETITIGTKVYEITNLAEDNGYTVTMEVK